MKSALLVLAILLPVVSTAAQPVAEPAPEKCTVEGQVVAAATGQPLKKARLLLDKMEARTQPFLAVTDAAGRFKFSEIEPGRYLLSVWRNGYVNQQFGQRSSNRRPTVLALEPGQHMQDIVFRLVRHAVIAGRVYDEDGEPVPRVNVQVLRYRYVGSERQLAPAGAGSTNDLGEYRIYDLPPGRYYVSADYSPRFRAFTRAQIRRSMGRRQSTDAESYAPTYYPGTNDPAYATPIELRAGDELSSIDFNLSPTRTVRVSGRVVNTISGKLGLNTMVALLPRTSLRRMAFFFRNRVSVDNAEGTFEVRGVVPGSYILTATYIHQEEGQQYATRLPIEVGSMDIEGITLVIERGMDLSARIYLEGGAALGQPGSGVAVGQAQDQFDMTEVGVYLSPFDSLSILPRPSSGRAKPDGSFKLENVPRDRYRVNVLGLPRDYYLKAARVGGRDVLEVGLDLTGGALPNPLEITISAAAGRIDGAVLTEEQEPFGGASVVLVPEEGRRDQRRFYKTTTTDQHGRFTLRGIPPGDYKLFAWEEIERGAYRDTAFLRPYEDRGEPVQVRERDQLSVQLRLIPADSPPR
jgi:protocatechuate 3,4-dioxygenase beta subunit